MSNVVETTLSHFKGGKGVPGLYIVLFISHCAVPCKLRLDGFSAGKSVPGITSGAGMEEAEILST